MNSSSEQMNACAHHGYKYQHCAKDYSDPNANGHHRLNQGLFEFATEEPLSPLGCSNAPSAEANGCSIQSFIFVPRSPPWVCCFSSPPLTAGFCCRGVRGVYGAAERRHAAPAVVGRLGLVLDTELGFWASGRTTDGRTDETGLPPKLPWFFEQETATELGSRFPFICGSSGGRVVCLLCSPSQSVSFKQ